MMMLGVGTLCSVNMVGRGWGTYITPFELPPKSQNVIRILERRDFPR